jgi:hypothetical protein
VPNPEQKATSFGCRLESQIIELGTVAEEPLSVFERGRADPRFDGSFQQIPKHPDGQRDMRARAIEHEHAVLRRRSLRRDGGGKCQFQIRNRCVRTHCRNLSAIQLDSCGAQLKFAIRQPAQGKSSLRIAHRKSSDCTSDGHGLDFHPAPRLIFGTGKRAGDSQSVA